MKEIDELEAGWLVDALGPHTTSSDLGYPSDYISRTPVFPDTRKDVCVIQRDAQYSIPYGFDVIYLIWKSDEVKKVTDQEREWFESAGCIPSGHPMFDRILQMHHEELESSKGVGKPGDEIRIDDILEDEKDIIVKLSRSAPRIVQYFPTFPKEYSSRQHWEREYRRSKSDLGLE